MGQNLNISFVFRPRCFLYPCIKKSPGMWEPLEQRTTSFNIRLTKYKEVYDRVRG